MRKKYLLLLLQLLCGMIGAMAQQSGSLSQEELLRISRLPPGEQEKYKEQLLKVYEKQAKVLAAKTGVVINEELTGTGEVKKPAIDTKRLASIPNGVPSAVAIQTEIGAIDRSLRTLVDKSVITAVDTTMSRLSGSGSGMMAVFSWYKNQPYHAVLMALAAAKKAPEDVAVLNNLSAMLTMAGLPEKSVPVLRYILKAQPANSTALNNMGQSYMRMGDMQTAEMQFKQCLQIDRLNPEANHAMAMIEVFRKNFSKAAEYFTQELLVVQRPTTLSRMQKKRIRLNLFQLYKQRLKMSGRRGKNYFGEVELEKFEMPDFPAEYAGMKELYQKHLNYQLSVQEEQVYWLSAVQLNEGQLKRNAQKGFPMYFDVIEQLMEDLHEDFPDEYLQLYTPDEMSFRNTLEAEYNTELEALQCELPPQGADSKVVLAYQKICCEKKVKADERYFSRLNSHVYERYNTVKNRWKDYINQLIYLVSFAPTAGNRAVAYSAVAGYFGFLSAASNAGYFSKYPPECLIDMTLEEAKAVIESSRNLDLTCPPNLAFKLNFKLKIPGTTEGAKVKIEGNCEEYNLEGNWGPLSSSYNKNFKTGMSTLAVGVEAGADFNFEKYMDGKLGLNGKQEFFVSYDRNNVMADAGFRGEGEAVIEINDIEIVKGEAKYTLAMNAGFDGEAGGDTVFNKLYQKLSAITGTSSGK